MSDLSDDAGWSASQDDTSRVWTSNSVVGDVSGVVVQAQSIGTVVFGAPGVASVPIEDAICDLDPVLAAVLDGGFTGREWLIDEIDQFIKQRRCGYVWVEAPAGLGKSALAAHLVQARGWLGHFARVSRGGTSRVGLQNLAGQLIERYQLWDCAPGRILPERASTPEGFERVLGQAARCAREAGDQLVLVVDGADEADPADGQQPWGLPADLPAGVFVVGTYRTGFPPPPAQPCQVLHIHPSDDRNQHDLADHLEVLVRGEDIAACLAEAGVSQDRFVVDVAQRCGGVWVYLRYVLEEIRHGLREPHRLDDLPADLSSYYTVNVQRWSADPAWHEGILPLLATLAVAGESVPATTLAALSGVDERLVRQWCYGLLRPFLTVTVSPPPAAPTEATPARAFAIYHASVRELLTGAPPPSASSDHGWMWCELLRSAATAAHSRIADYYLTLFGGLDTDLARLAVNPDLATGDNGYPLRHLARHLVASGRATDLHRLLQAERPIGPGRAANVWFTAHDAADTIDDYLADIATARQDSQHRTDDALAAGLPACSLAEELRYWLITASIASLTTTISSPLLLCLLQQRIWTTTRALSHARRLRAPEARAHALGLLAPHVPTDQRQMVLAEALDAATHTTDHNARAEALAGLVPLLRAKQQAAVLARALDTAAHAADYILPKILVELASRLPTKLSGKALKAATYDLWDYYDYLLPSILTALAPRLPAKLLSKALDTATHIRAEDHRAEALAGLAPHLPADQQPAVFAEALHTARNAADGYSRAHALAAVVPHLPADQRAAVSAEALHTARNGSDGYRRADVLTNLVPYLPAEQRPAVLTEVLHIATQNTETTRINADSQADTLVRLAPHLSAELLAEALDAVTHITHEDVRAQVLIGLAPHLSAELLPEALDAATHILDGSTRAEVLTGMVPYLPVARRRGVVAEALDAAIHIDRDGARAQALTGLLSYLPVEQRPAAVAEALDAATHILDGSTRAEVLTGMVPHLPVVQRPGVAAEALDIAIHIDHDGARTTALTGLAPLLSADQLAEALDAITHIDYGYTRAKALTGLASHLPAELFAEALDAANDIWNGEFRVSALDGLVPHLPVVQRPAALADALEAAMHIVDERARARVLAGLAPHLPADQQLAVLAQALDAARHVARDWERADALADLVPHFPDEQRPAVLAEALNTARHIDGRYLVNSDYSRARIFVRLVRYLPIEQRPAMLAEVLRTITYLISDSERADLLAALAPQLSADHLTAALDATAHITKEDDRAWVLTRLVPHLPDEQQPAVLADALNSATHSYNRAEALTGLAPLLSAKQLADALDAVPYGDNTSRLAVLARAEELFGPRGELMSLLRIAFLNFDRFASLKVLISLMSTLQSIAGQNFAEHAVTEIRAVHRWWA